MEKLNEQQTIFRPASAEPEISFLLHEKGRRLGLPISGTFELCSRCNFSCKMCYIHQKGDTDKGELSAEKWLELGKKARDAGTVFLLLTGGEPLLRSDFKEIYTGLKKLGLVVSVNTNGSLLTDEIAELFIKDPPYKLNVTLYGADDESYKNLCGVPAFSKVIKNIENLKNHSVQIKINCSITPENCCQIEQIYALTKKLGLNVKATTYMYPPMRTNDAKVGENRARLSAKEAARYRVKWDEERYSKDEFILRVRGLEAGIIQNESECIVPTEDSDKMRCRAGSSSFWINYKGEMSACGVMTNEAFDTKMLGFERAWQLVKESTAKIRLPKECSSCRYRHFCNVCAAVCFCETGRTDQKAEYVCELSRLTAEFSKQRVNELLNGDENGEN